MDFQLTDEQALLRDTTRNLLSRSYDQESRNKVADSELGWSREVWNQLAEIGILGLGFDEDTGGQIEIAVVMTEVGRALAPEPVAFAALAPGSLIAELGHGEQRALLDDVATARAALEERGVQFNGETLDTGVCHMAFFADPDGNALMLHHRYAPRLPRT